MNSLLMKRLPLVAALSIALAAAAAHAASPTGAQGTRAKIDANGDGMIDRSEAAAHPRLAERFDQLDKNRDGKIDASERPQRGQGGAPGGRHGGGMAKLDVNGDGAISLDEAAGHQRLLDKFEMIDTNADASLSRQELQAWRAQQGGRRGPGATGGKP